MNARRIVLLLAAAGLAATVTVSLYVTRVARAALREDGM